MLRASTYVHELFDVTQAVLKWRQYLLGHHFSILTYHHSLKEIVNQAIHKPEQRKYLVKLLGYDFDITYHSGKSNIVPDAFSRRCEPEPSGSSTTGQLLFFSIPIFKLIDQIKAEVASEPYYHDLLLKPTTSFHSPFFIRDGLIYKNHRICLNPSSPLISKLLFEFHNTPVAGHGGVSKTLARIAQGFYWVNMNHDILTYVAAC